MLKNLIKKILYQERSTSLSYTKYLRKKLKYLGSNLYIVDSTHLYINDKDMKFISIGDNVQLLSNVTILAHDESYTVCGYIYNDLPRSQKEVSIGNNVFIGYGTTILMGSQIGDNVIIGANSVVAGKIESNAVYAGNPARFIMTLDQYYEKHSQIFVDSAYLYVKAFIEKNNRNPTMDEITLYRVLFESGGFPRQSANSPKDHITEIGINMKKRYGQFKSIDEFIDNYEKNRNK